MLPKLAFTSFASRYRAPKLEEGFKEIVQVDFVVSIVHSYLPIAMVWYGRGANRAKFTGSDAQRALWSKYWI